MLRFAWWKYGFGCGCDLVLDLTKWDRMDCSLEVRLGKLVSLLANLLVQFVLYVNVGLVSGSGDVDGQVLVSILLLLLFRLMADSPFI